LNGVASGAAGGFVQAEGERLRHAQQAQALARQQTGFGRADEQHAILADQAPQHLHRVLLGGRSK
jgi:hypothetical protein